MNKPLTIGIIVFDGVLTPEVTGPAEVFALAGEQEGLAGTRALLIGVAPQPSVRTEEGLRLAVDATIADDVALDALLVPGANDMGALLGHGPLNAFIRRQAERDSWLASVCAGAFLLGSAGVLDGRQATTWFGGEASLQEQFPAVRVVRDQPVVVDDRRITANGGLVSYQAALVLLGRLAGAASARKVYGRLGIERLGRWPEIEAGIAAALA